MANSQAKLMGLELVGSRLRVTTADGRYAGILHSLDLDNGRVTLEKVVCENGKRATGLYHFFGYEIKQIEILEDQRNKTHKKKANDNGSYLLRKKSAPHHLKKLMSLDDRELLLTNASAVDSTASMNKPTGPSFKRLGSLSEMKESADNDDQKWPSTYIVVDSFDHNFQQALEHISQHSIIGVAIEGVRLGRQGQLAWIQMGTRSQVFIFDVLTLGKDVFERGLREILQSPRILKVIHDCRQMSDMLHHQYNVELLNVFDTQVAETTVYRTTHKGTLPRYVTGLSPCLVNYLNLSRDHAFFYRQRESTSLDDQRVWLKRPAPERVLEVAMRHTMYLVELRARILEELLREFTEGVDLYLSVIRDASDETFSQKEKTIHLLPKEFRNIGSETSNLGMHRFRDRFQGSNHWDDDGFRENCAGLLDTSVILSLDGIPHKGCVQPEEGVRRGQQLQECHNMGPSSMVRHRTGVHASATEAVQSAPELEDSSILGLGASLLKQSDKKKKPATSRRSYPEKSVTSSGSSESFQFRPAGLVTTAEPSERYIAEVGIPVDRKSRRSAPAKMGVLKQTDKDTDAFDAIPSHRTLRSNVQISPKTSLRSSDKPSSDVEERHGCISGTPVDVGFFSSPESVLQLPSSGGRPQGRGIRAQSETPRPGPTPPQSLLEVVPKERKVGVSIQPSIVPTTPKTPTAPVGRAQLIALLQQFKVAMADTRSVSPMEGPHSADQFSDSTDDTTEDVTSSSR